MGKFVFTWKRSVKKRSRCIQWEISGMHCALAFTILLWLASQDPCSDDPLNGKRHSVIFSVKKDGFCHSLEQTAPFIQLWVDFRIWICHSRNINYVILLRSPIGGTIWNSSIVEITKSAAQEINLKESHTFVTPHFQKICSSFCFLCEVPRYLELMGFSACTMSPFAHFTENCMTMTEESNRSICHSGY